MGVWMDALPGVRAAYESAVAAWREADQKRDNYRDGVVKPAKDAFEAAKKDFDDFVAAHPNANGSTYQAKLKAKQDAKADLDKKQNHLEELRTIAQNLNQKKDEAQKLFENISAAALQEQQAEAQAAAAVAAGSGAASTPAPSATPATESEPAETANGNNLDVANERRLLKNAEGNTLVKRFASVYGDDKARPMMENVLISLKAQGKIKNFDYTPDGTMRVKYTEGGEWVTDVDNIVDKITSIEGWSNPTNGDTAIESPKYLLNHTKGSSVLENFTNVFGNDDSSIAMNGALRDLNIIDANFAVVRNGDYIQSVTFQGKTYTDAEEITKLLANTNSVNNLLATAASPASTSPPSGDASPATPPVGPGGEVTGTDTTSSAPTGTESLDIANSKRLLRNSEGGRLVGRFRNVYGFESGETTMNTILNDLSSKGIIRVREEGGEKQVKFKGTNNSFDNSDNWLSDPDKIIYNLTEIEGWDSAAGTTNQSAQYLLENTRGSSTLENFKNVFGDDDAKKALRSAAYDLELSGSTIQWDGDNIVSITTGSTTYNGQEDMTSLLANTDTVKNKIAKIIPDAAANPLENPADLGGGAGTSIEQDTPFAWNISRLEGWGKIKLPVDKYDPNYGNWNSLKIAFDADRGEGRRDEIERIWTSIRNNQQASDRYREQRMAAGWKEEYTQKIDFGNYSYNIADKPNQKWNISMLAGWGTVPMSQEEADPSFALWRAFDETYYAAGNANSANGTEYSKDEIANLQASWERVMNNSDQSIKYQLERLGQGWNPISIGLGDKYGEFTGGLSITEYTNRPRFFDSLASSTFEKVVSIDHSPNTQTVVVTPTTPGTLVGPEPETAVDYSNRDRVTLIAYGIGGDSQRMDRYVNSMDSEFIKINTDSNGNLEYIVKLSDGSWSNDLGHVLAVMDRYFEKEFDMFEVDANVKRNISIASDRYRVQTGVLASAFTLDSTAESTTPGTLVGPEPETAVDYGAVATDSSVVTEPRVSVTDTMPAASVSVDYTQPASSIVVEDGNVGGGFEDSARAAINQYKDSVENSAYVNDLSDSYLSGANGGGGSAADSSNDGRTSALAYPPTQTPDQS